MRLPPALLVGGICATASAVAAPAFVQNNAVQNNCNCALATVSLPNASVPGDLAVLVITYTDNLTSTGGISDVAGDHYAQAVAPVSWNAGNYSTEVWDAPIGPTDGGLFYTTVLLTPSASSTFLYLTEYRGLDPILPISQVATQAAVSSTGTVSSGSKPAPLNGGLVFGHAEAQGAILAAGPAFVSRLQAFGNVEEDRPIGDAGVVSADFQINTVGQPFVAIMLALNQGSASGDGGMGSTDAGPPSDGGMSLSDAGPPSDGGMGSTDAGSPGDGGMGWSDAGSDAGLRDRGGTVSQQHLEVGCGCWGSSSRAWPALILGVLLTLRRAAMGGWRSSRASNRARTTSSRTRRTRPTC